MQTIYICIIIEFNAAYGSSLYAILGKLAMNEGGYKMNPNFIRLHECSFIWIKIKANHEILLNSPHPL